MNHDDHAKKHGRNNGMIMTRFHHDHGTIMAWLWWVCGCRSKCVIGADNSLASSGMLCRVSSFTFDMSSVSLFLDAFSREALTPTRPLRSEFADTLVASRPEDAFIDLIASSILGATTFSIAVKIEFCILSSTVSTILLISLSILSLKHLSKVFTVIALPLTTESLLEVPTVKSWSLVPSLTTAFSNLSLTSLPIIISWSKSSNWLRSLLFDCLFLRVETMFVLITELYWEMRINSNTKSKMTLQIVKLAKDF